MKMRFQRSIRQLFAKSGVTVDPSVDDRTIGDVLKALDQSGETRQSALREPEKRRITMDRRIGIAVAAAILLAVLVGIHFLGGSADGTGIVWAQVAKQMDVIENFTCRMTSWQNQATDDASARKETMMSFQYSNQYGYKMEQYAGGECVMIEYFLRQTSEGVRIWPETKTYIRMRWTDEELALGPAQQMDPRDWVRRFTEADVTSLGTRMVDGVEVEGVQTNDLGVIRSASSPCQDYAARLWVDVQTQLPVSIEEEYTIDGVRTGGGANQFQWNPGLTATDFVPEIPSDYVDRNKQAVGSN
jgi:hypothetical protein